MRLFLWSLWAVALMASVAIAAQDSSEKEAAPAAQSDESSDDKQADAKDDEGDVPADEKPAKKTPKKAIGIKIAGEDDATVLHQLSYMQGFAIGQQMFQQFTQQGVELDEEVFLAALKDAMTGKEPAMTEEEMKTASAAIQKFLGDKYAAKAKEQAAKNKEEGIAFLAENKKKEGIKTLPSGLQYKVMKSGKGESPNKTDTVKAHYKGTFISGKEFENSYKNGVPVALPLPNLVKGMAEALQLMKVGDKWQLFIPPTLAYGEQGNRLIPPNATLVFDLELLGIEKGSKASPASPSLKLK